MKIRSLIQTSLTLMMLTACGPNGQLTSATLPQNSPTGSQSGLSGQGSQSALITGNQTQSTSSAGATTASSSSVSATLKSDLTAMHEEEAIYTDAATVAEADSGFATKAVGGTVGSTLGLDIRVRMPASTRPLPGPGGRKLPQAQAKDLRTQFKSQLALQAGDRSQFTSHLMNAAAVTVNGDGTITLDPKAFKQSFNQHMQQEKAQFENNLLKLKGRLELKKQITGDALRKLYHHDFVTRTSDKVTVQNADGSTTETIKISFENSRNGIKRETTLAKTSKDNKILKVEFQLNETTPAFTRTVTRVATHNADGSKNVLLDAKITWKDGRSCERHQERVVKADGSATGTGTITRTAKDGSSKTYTFNVNITVSGEMTTAASDPQSQTDVVLDEQANGDATVVVQENGQASAAEVDVAADATAAATDSSPTAEASPAATASPSAEATASPSAAPTASPSAEATASPSAEPTASPSASV